MKHQQVTKENQIYHQYRPCFHIQEGYYYMDGNSLGLMSDQAQETMALAMEDWKREGIRIWGIKDEKYFQYPQILGRKMSGLIKAQPDEVIATGSITSNIHQAVLTFYHPTETRYKIVVDALNFPTDRYAIESILKLKGLDRNALVVVGSDDGNSLNEADIIAALGDDVALVLLPAVLYRSAQLLDMKGITKAAHDRGIIIGWDLAHSIGIIDHDFSEIEPDFGVWCTYKYLNGGPGAVGGLYINKRHFKKKAGLQGWFGNKNESQFQLNPVMDQACDASGWLQGTPHIMSMAGLEGALGMFEAVGMTAIRQASLSLTDFLMAEIEDHLEPLGFSIGNPKAPDQRGGHVCLVHDEAYRISIALRDNKVIPDFREPNVIRLAPVPFYVGYKDIQEVIQIIKRIVEEKLYEHYTRKRVTVV